MTRALPRPGLRRSARGRLAVLGAVALALGAVAAPLLPAAPASAAARVTVTAPDGSAITADPEYATRTTVTGSGFQSIASGFGGIYVLFGWVRGGADGPWRPSAGGTVGADYRYVPDSETKDNAGFERFVAFPGSDTESAANAIMGADGSWSVDLTLPAARFESRDRDNAVIAVDCTKVTCGVITIGAHGVKNARNETFTPVSYTAATSGTDAAAGTADAPAAATGAARVGLASSSVAAGDALVFTGKGFQAGEQVVAVLDDGAAAVGPLTVGASGDVAGVLSVPRALRAGTHALTLTGAASGAVASTEVSVTGGGAVAASAVEAEPMWPYLLLGIAAVVALVLLVLAVVTTIVRGRRRRRLAASVAASESAADADAPRELATEHA